MWFKKSFKYASQGFREVIKLEKNFQIELAIGATVLVAAWLLPLPNFERALVLLVVGFVLVLELINSALERVVDGFYPKLEPLARVIKDIMAAAVLLGSVFALAIGIVIFYPYLKEFSIFNF